MNAGRSTRLQEIRREGGHEGGSDGGREGGPGGGRAGRTEIRAGSHWAVMTEEETLGVGLAQQLSIRMQKVCTCLQHG